MISDRSFKGLKFGHISVFDNTVIDYMFSLNNRMMIDNMLFDVW